jgi:hypothetical protein
MSGTPDQSDVGSCWVNVKVWDKYVSRDANFTIEVLNVNDPPEITTTNVLFCEDGEEYLVDYEAYDEDPDDAGDLVWKLETNATFLSLDTATGVLSGSPLLEHAGSYWVRISVEDGNGGSDHTNFTLTILHDNRAPIIVTEDVSICYEEQMYLVDYEAEDLETGDGELRWELDTDASFLLFDPFTGTLWGIPDDPEVGTYNVNISVIDEVGAWDSSLFDLEVVNVNDPPLIITSDETRATQDILYFEDYEAIDPDPTNDTLVWRVETEAGFLEMDAASGILFGTPANDDVGEYHVTVNVSDGNGGYDQTTFLLKVGNVNDEPVVIDDIDQYSLYEDTVDTGVDLNEWFQDADGGELQFDFKGNNRIGLKALADGTLEITPQRDWSGMETVKFTATDHRYTVTKEVRVYVLPVNDAPTNASIQLEERTTLYRVWGSAQDADLSYGDELTFTWGSNISGELGTGEEMEFTLPEGEHLITLTVTDKEGCYCQAELELEVSKDQVSDPEEDDDESPGKGSMSTSLWLLLLIPLIVLLILGAAIGAFLFTRRKKDTNIAPLVQMLPDPGEPVPIPMAAEEASPIPIPLDETEQTPPVQLVPEPVPEIMPEAEGVPPIEVPPETQEPEQAASFLDQVVQTPFPEEPAPYDLAPMEEF